MERRSRKALIWSAARTLDSAPVVNIEIGSVFLPKVNDAHRCGWDGKRLRCANMLRTILLEATVPAGFVLSVSHLSSCSASFPDSSLITSQQLRFPTKAAMNPLLMRHSSQRITSLVESSGKNLSTAVKGSAGVCLARMDVIESRSVDQSKC